MFALSGRSGLGRSRPALPRLRAARGHVPPAARSSSTSCPRPCRTRVAPRRRVGFLAAAADARGHRRGGVRARRGEQRGPLAIACSAFAKTGSPSRSTTWAPRGRRRRARPLAPGLKVDASVVRGIDRNLVKQEIFATIARQGGAVGAVVAVGVESAEEAATPASARCTRRVSLRRPRARQRWTRDRGGQDPGGSPARRSSVRVRLLLAVIIMVSASAPWSGVAGASQPQARVAEIVRLLEEMRAGRPRPASISMRLRGDRRIGEPLGQDLAVRWTRGLALKDSKPCEAAAVTPSSRPTATAIGPSRPGPWMFGWDEDAVVARNASLLFDETPELLEAGPQEPAGARRRDPRLMATRTARGHARVHVRLLRARRGKRQFCSSCRRVGTGRVEIELKRHEAARAGSSRAFPTASASCSGAHRLQRPLRPARSAIATRRHPVAGPHRHGDVWSCRTRSPASRRARSLVRSLRPLRDDAGRVLGDARLAAAHDDTTANRRAPPLRDETATRRVIRSLAAQEASRHRARRGTTACYSSRTSRGHARAPGQSRFLDAFGLARPTSRGPRNQVDAPALRLGRGGGVGGACLAKAARSRCTSWPFRRSRSPLRAAFGPPGEASRGRLLSVRDATAEPRPARPHRGRSGSGAVTKRPRRVRQATDCTTISKRASRPSG
jgi:hypothetical protein